MATGYDDSTDPGDEQPADWSGVQEGEELVGHEEDSGSKDQLTPVHQCTEKYYVIFFSQATDGRLDFLFSDDRLLAQALNRAAQATADGLVIKVYEWVQTYEVRNGRKLGI
jgi:hypothetical protein